MRLGPTLDRLLEHLHSNPWIRTFLRQDSQLSGVEAQVQSVSVEQVGGTATDEAREWFPGMQTIAQPKPVPWTQDGQPGQIVLVLATDQVVA
jgi:hypothetical protein